MESLIGVINWGATDGSLVIGVTCGWASDIICWGSVVRFLNRGL